MIRKGQVSEMDCRTAESMVAGYINHTLKVDELEDFLDHIEHCPSCYDELETYFIVHEVTKQLDKKEEDDVSDFRELLEEDIRKSRRYIHKKRGIQFAAGMFTALLTVALVIFLIFMVIEIRQFF